MIDTHCHIHFPAYDADRAEMLARARALLPDDRHSLGVVLTVVVSGGPRQQVLRPRELEGENAVRSQLGGRFPEELDGVEAVQLGRAFA